MSVEEINIAISEIMGFVPSKTGDWWHTPDGNQCFASELPNYAGCLNAMKSARCALSDAEHSVYVSRLADVIILRSYYKRQITTFDYLDAPAVYHAEAFLRTIGEWKEAAGE